MNMISENIIIELIKFLGTVLVTVVPLFIAIVNNRKKSVEAMDEKIEAMKADQKIQNKELKQQISSIENEVNTLREEHNRHVREDEDSTAQQVRVRILSADDELCDPQRPWPSWGSFEQMLIDCNTYRSYCAKHEDFTNNIANEAIESIEKKYRHCKDNCLYGKPKEKNYNGD